MYVYNRLHLRSILYCFDSYFKCNCLKYEYESLCNDGLNPNII